MESSLPLLLSLLRATTAWRNSATKPALALAADDPALLLAEIAPTALVAAVSAALREISQGQARAAQALPRLRALAAQLDQIAGAEPQRAAQIETLTRQLQTYTLINGSSGVESSALTHVAIHLAESDLAQLVREWHIGATDAGPAILVVSMAPPGEHRVRLRGSSYIERRVTLHYQTNQTHPQLSVRALSATARDDQPQADREWPQPPLADYDLTIFTEQERIKGRVFTWQTPTPLVVRGAVFTLILEGPSNALITTTEFRDELDNPLARVHLWPPVVPAPPPG